MGLGWHQFAAIGGEYLSDTETYYITAILNETAHFFWITMAGLAYRKLGSESPTATAVRSTLVITIPYLFLMIAAPIFAGCWEAHPTTQTVTNKLGAPIRYSADFTRKDNIIHRLPPNSKVEIEYPYGNPQNFNGKFGIWWRTHYLDKSGFIFSQEMSPSK